MCDYVDLRLSTRATQFEYLLLLCQGQSNRLYLRYAKRMVIISNIVCGSWAFLSQFFHVLERGIRKPSQTLQVQYKDYCRHFGY